MRRLWQSLVAATLAIGLGAGTAVAGPVQIFSDYARGDMGTAHNSPTGMYIGCWVDNDTSSSLLYCEAFDGVAGLTFCMTTNMGIINTASAIADSSDIEFGWDDAHVCSFLMVGNFSQYPGRKP